MTKTYCANIAVDMVEYFENRLKEKGVKMISRELLVNSDEPYYRYIVLSEEGLINPRYEVKP